MRTATYLRDVTNYRGHASLYRLDPPASLGRWASSSDDAADHVIVSAIDVPDSGPETYIFAADQHGKVTNWGELEGSFQGGLDHERALRDAGYEVAA